MYIITIIYGTFPLSVTANDELAAQAISMHFRSSINTKLHFKLKLQTR